MKLPSKYGTMVLTRRLSGKLRPRRGRTNFIKLRKSLKKRLRITPRQRRRLPILLPNLRIITASYLKLSKIPRDTDKRIKKVDALIHQIEMIMSHRMRMSTSTSPNFIKDPMDAIIIILAILSLLFRKSISGVTIMTMIIRLILNSDVI